MIPTGQNEASTTGPQTIYVSDPQLTDRTPVPRGVLQRKLKMYVYFGGVLVVIVAMLLGSAKSAKTGTDKKANPTGTPQVFTSTAQNVATLKAQIAQEKHETGGNPAFATAAHGQPVQAEADWASANSIGGLAIPQPVNSSGVAQPGYANSEASQTSPAELERQLLAVKEREREEASRFESNLVYSRAAESDQQQTNKPRPTGAFGGVEREQPATVAPARTAGEQSPGQDGRKRPMEVNVDAAVGQPYIIHEGSNLDSVLMNRLDGDAAGPVKVLVSSPLYSHDNQHVLVPEGTVVLGEARSIGGTGFGQKRRMAIAFHRMIMPDGYSVDLDQFRGLDQIGTEGLKDQVNNHYLQIFGISIALGVISSAAQIAQGGTGYNATGAQSFTTGATGGVSQQATTVLDRFIEIPPTITIREGHRIKVYFTQDLLLPAYENHRIAQTF